MKVQSNRTKINPLEFEIFFLFLIANSSGNNRNSNTVRLIRKRADDLGDSFRIEVLFMSRRLDLRLEKKATSFAYWWGRVSFHFEENCSQSSPELSRDVVPPCKSSNRRSSNEQRISRNQLATSQHPRNRKKTDRLNFPPSNGKLFRRDFNHANEHWIT